ncbi:MAG: AI-2E family transporter [Elusimicrobiales bacterium]|nr:AI-2E family transporter [Elusimicrobiales bacterium]
MKDEIKISKRFVINIVISVFVILFIYSFIKLISPFLISLFLSVTFTVVFYPIYIFFKKLKFSQTIASFLSMLAVLIIFVVPLFLFGWLLFKEAKLIYPSIVDHYNNIDLSRIKIPHFIPISISDIREIVTSNIDQIQKSILRSGGSVVKNIFFFFVNLSIMFVSMFFFFRDGKKILSYLIDIVPFSNESIERVLRQFEISVNSIIRGIILTAFIQGIVAMFGFYIAGLSSPALLGLFVMISALIPFIGTATVTIPVIIYCYFTKPIAIFLFVFIWCFFVVGLIDNFIRPIFIGNFSKMPIGLVFLGIIGGVKSFGPAGLFIGPIFIAIFITVIDIYLKDKKAQIQEISYNKNK